MQQTLQTNSVSSINVEEEKRSNPLIHLLVLFKVEAAFPTDILSFRNSQHSNTMQCSQWIVIYSSIVSSMKMKISSCQRLIRRGNILIIDRK